MLWLLLVLNVSIYVYAFYHKRESNKSVRVYQYFLGVQLLLFFGYVIIDYSGLASDNDPTHLGHAYFDLMYYFLQALAFNALCIVFLIRTLTASVVVKIGLFLAVLAVQFNAAQGL